MDARQLPGAQGRGLGPRPALVVRVPARAFIACAGDAAEDYLQSQLTCDVRGARDGRSVPGAYCTPEGRVISVFRLLPWGGRIVLGLAADVAGATQKQLEFYRIATPVTIERLDGISTLGIAGDGARDWLEDNGLPVPESGLTAAWGDGIVVALDGPVPRYTVHAPAARCAALRVDKPEDDDLRAWRLLAMRSADVDLPASLSEAFTANMLNLDELGAVSFDKGCFPGQEVVARTRHLGRPPRRLRRARFRGGAAAEPGTKIVAIRGDERRTGGTVLEAVDRGDGAVEVIAVVVENQLDADALRVGESDDAPVLEGFELLTNDR